jgi:hypothetical protein
MKDPMRPTKDDPLVIIVGIQHDGAAYDLHPRSEKRIAERFPDANSLSAVFLGHRRKAEFPDKHRPNWLRVAVLLTGLTEEQLAQLGGVVIYSPEREEVLWEWVPAATHRG